MVRKLSIFSVILVTLMLIMSFSTSVFNPANVTSEYSFAHSLEKTDVFTPTVQKPAWVDQDNNRIADTLDQEIAERTANGTTQSEIGVTVMLKSEPTNQDVDDFVSSGGQLTTSLWTEATYGFGGTITYRGIGVFSQKCSDLLLVEKETVGEATVAYAAQQVGARTYVWNTMGLQGDPNSSIAILDTGIDASHVDFSPGYGDQDFSKKIVGWQDFVNFTNSPFDDNGHGSHVSGLAAGNGFSSVDASGRATAIWQKSANSSVYTGMMVNNSGTITLSTKWSSNGTAQASTLILYNSGKSITSWNQVASTNIPNPDTWYTLTYNVVSVPFGGYDMYNPAVSITAGTGVVSFVVNMSWPYTPPSDNFSMWTGIAPESKLVSVKVDNSAGLGTSSQIISGINWLIVNRVPYHVTVASLSLGFDREVSSVDQALVNLVNSGVTTVVAAGNDGEGGNHIYSPGSVDEAVTVAAINQFDNVASYSSQGGTSTYTGKTTKPDIVAPGGSMNAVPLYSSDFGSNNSSPKQGTSMATPIIAGCIQSLIQAMGGYSNWNYSRRQALQPKMILLMTATETYPNPREQDTSSLFSPSLERGGKDVHEGFGRVNFDAAVDAVLRSYTVGTVASDSLGKPPTTSDISVVGQKLAWARNVQLTKGYMYNFSLSVPASADYDLYLYNSVGTNYGDPIIYAKSTNVTTGGTEQFYITPTTTGTYYVVVKRATETTGSGNFTLTSSQSIVTSNVVLNTPGCVNASNVVHYAQNGIPKNGSIVAGSFSDLVDAGTILTVDNPIFVSSTQRYSTTQPTTFEVRNPIIENLTIENSHPYPNNYNNSWTITRSNATRMRVHFSNIFTEGLFDNVTVKSLTSPTNAYNWSGGPSEAFWTEWLFGGAVQIRLTSDGSVTNYGFLIDQIEWMSSEALSYSADFKTEYYLSVNSPFGSTIGVGWYENGTNATPAMSTSTVDQLNGTQRVFMNWGGDASGAAFQASEPIFMNASKTATANWKTQYLVSFTSTPSNGGLTNPAATNMWIDLGDVSISATPNSNYLFSGWSKSTGDITFLDAASTSTAATINGPGTINANFVGLPTPTPTATPTASPSAQPSQSASTKPPATSTPTQAPTATPASSQTPSASPTIPEFPQTVIMLLIAALFLVVTVGLVTHQRYNTQKSKKI